MKLWIIVNGFTADLQISTKLRKFWGRAIFRVHFAKLNKNYFKSTISFMSPNQFSLKELVKSNMQDKTVMEVSSESLRVPPG